MVRGPLYRVVAVALLLSQGACLSSKSESNSPNTADVPGADGSVDRPVTALSLQSGQAADVEIGEVDRVSPSGGATSTKIVGPAGVSFFGPTFFISDNGNHRVLGFSSVPSGKGKGADFVLGQWEMTGNVPGTLLSQMKYPQNALVLRNRLFVIEDLNNRILVWNTVPHVSGTAADFQIGGGVTGGCSQTELKDPESVALAGNRLVVSDSGNNRVLIFNEVPTSTGAIADVVLGQSDFTSSVNPSSPNASNMLTPLGLWSDGRKLIVSDSGQNRILIWNSIPTINNQPADVVVGQTDFVSKSAGVSSSKLRNPWGIDSNGVQLFVVDQQNNRVLVWNKIPESNGVPADTVLGQSEFAGQTPGTGSAGMNAPVGIAVNPVTRQLAVSDNANNRVLIFNGK